MAAEALLAAARLHYPHGPFAEGLAYAVAALGLVAERGNDQGSAYFFSGWFRANLGRYSEARRDLERALTFAAPDALAQRADVVHGLANVDFLEGDHAAARRGYEEMLDLARRDGNAETVARAMTGLREIEAQGET